MGTVKGPYDRGDWITMKMLKQSIALMEERKKPKLELPIKAEKKLLKNFFNREAA